MLLFGLRLVRFMPQALRPVVIRGADALQSGVLKMQLAAERPYLAVNRPGPPEFPADAPVTLIGLFSSPSGIGQGARLVWEDLKSRGRPVTAVDATGALHLPGGPLPDGVLNARALAELPPGPFVFHLNPPRAAAFYFKLPRSLRRRAKLIANWVWELEKMLETWRLDASLFDEFWVPSDFVAGALRRLLGPEERRPIRVVPYAVDAISFGPRKTPETSVEMRVRHGLPQDAFLVGNSFAMSSSFARKNPMAAIAAFQMALPAASVRDARLLLRCAEKDGWPPGDAQMAAAAAADERITVLDSSARRIPIGDFYYAIDVYLSLHRSEGYGLNLAEAARVGTPVIATGWGMAADIAKRPEVATIPWRLVPVEDPQGIYHTEAGVHWAEPDVAAAAEQLRQLYGVFRRAKEVS